MPGAARTLGHASRNIEESLKALDLVLAGEMERAMMKIHAKPPRPKPPRENAVPAVAPTPPETDA